MVPTGCDELDGLLSGGLRKGSLNTIASVPSMGKTGFSLSLVSSMARKGIRVVFFSFEMDSEGLMDRTIRGTTITTETPRDFANKIENISFICPHEGKLKELNESISSSDADVFFVDTIQLVSCPLSKDGPYNEANEISCVVKQLKITAREKNVPIVCLSQVSNKPFERTGHRVLPTDLYGSSAINMVSDVVIGFNRRDYYDPYDRPGRAEVSVLKNRYGKTGSFEARFDEGCCFFDLAQQENHPVCV